MQLIDQKCSVCSQDIKFTMDALYCSSCAKAYHKACLENGCICPACKRDITKDMTAIKAAEDKEAHRVYTPDWVAYCWKAPLLGVGALIAFGFMIMFLVGGVEKGLGGLGAASGGFMFLLYIACGLMLVGGLPLTIYCLVVGIRHNRPGFRKHGIAGAILYTIPILIYFFVLLL